MLQRLAWLSYSEARIKKTNLHIVLHGIMLCITFERCDCSEMEMDKYVFNLDVFTWICKVKHRDNKSRLEHVQFKVQELRTDCLKTWALVFAVLHTNRQEAFCHFIFQRKALLSKEKVCMFTIDLRLVAVCSADCVPCLAHISAALLKHLQIII